MSKNPLKSALIGMVATGFLATQAVAAGMIVGGYSEADIGQAEIVKAAQFAVATKNAEMGSKRVKLVKIRKAEQQVVAGWNYRMCLSVKDKKHTYRALAVVYAQLSGTLSLTSWQLNGC